MRDDATRKYSVADAYKTAVTLRKARELFGIDIADPGAPVLTDAQYDELVAALRKDIREGKC